MTLWGDNATTGEVTRGDGRTEGTQKVGGPWGGDGGQWGGGEDGGVAMRAGDKEVTDVTMR